MYPYHQCVSRNIRGHRRSIKGSLLKVKSGRGKIHMRCLTRTLTESSPQIIGRKGHPIYELNMTAGLCNQDIECSDLVAMLWNAVPNRRGSKFGGRKQAVVHEPHMEPFL